MEVRTVICASRAAARCSLRPPREFSGGGPFARHLNVLAINLTELVEQSQPLAGDLPTSIRSPLALKPHQRAEKASAKCDCDECFPRRGHQLSAVESPQRKPEQNTRVGVRAASTLALRSAPTGTEIMLLSFEAALQGSPSRRSACSAGARGPGCPTASSGEYSCSPASYRPSRLAHREAEPFRSCRRSE